MEDEDEEDNDKNREIRIWMDGAFDMMHYGHMNAFRQGKALGTYLIVGVNDDKSIMSLVLHIYACSHQIHQTN